MTMDDGGGCDDDDDILSANFRRTRSAWEMCVREEEDAILW